MIPVHLATRQKAWAALAVSAMLLVGCGAAQSPEPKAASTPEKSPTASAVVPTSSPSADTARPTPTQLVWKTHTLANGNFEIEMPSTWKLKEVEPISSQIDKETEASFMVLSQDGSELAELRTGGEQMFDFPVGPNQAKNTVFDSEIDPTGGMLNFSFISYQGHPNDAEIKLTAIEPEYQPTWDAGLENLYYSGGTGAFVAQLDSKSTLENVDPALQGAERFEAYAKTDQYKQLKRTMLSFKQLTGGTGNSESAEGQCVGAKYTYDLGDSGMTCDEAKSFLTQILEQPVHTGAAEIMGVGACLLEFEGAPGYCNIDESGGKFTYSEK